MGGLGRIYRRGKKGIVWIAFYVHGRQMRESTHSTSEAVARKLLAKRWPKCPVAHTSARPRNRSHVTICGAAWCATTRSTGADPNGPSGCGACI